VNCARTGWVLAFVNNHFAGYAPETVKQLTEQLGRKKE